MIKYISFYFILIQHTFWKGFCCSPCCEEGIPADTNVYKIGVTAGRFSTAVYLYLSRINLQKNNINLQVQLF